MQLEMGECFESVNDALLHTVNALGGFKKIGPALRPELSTEAAGQWLRDCLNPTRREKLSPEQVLLVLRTARNAGYHAAMEYVASSSGYKAPQPADPDQQRAALQQTIAAGMENLQRQMAQLAKLAEAAQS